ncbi:MAG: hypothetical protein IKS51_03485 [Erysipelotrichaceae bacterium]|nr:hypothetical protein [Erysipelotrichaceae bacterium]
MLKKVIIAFTVLLALSLIACYNAVKVNTRQLNIREESIYSAKIDEDTDGLLVAYFTDLYFGEFFKESDLQNLIAKIDAFHPDLIMFGGDLAVHSAEREYLLSCLSGLDATYGKYAVSGDLDDERNKDILREAGFVLLENDHNTIDIDRNSCINLIGLNDLVQGNPDPASAFSGVDNTRFTIVFSHCPDIFTQLNSYDFDYLLAGHSLGGQVYLPIIDLFNRPEGAKKYYKGKTTMNGKTLDISNGVGRTGKDARFLADSEIVLYTLHSNK